MLGTISGRVGLVATSTNTKFSSISFKDANADDPKKLPRIVGLANVAQTSSKLELNPVFSGYAGLVEVENFNDDDYMVQVNVDFNSQDEADIWVRYQNVDNGYRVIPYVGGIQLVKYVNGAETVIDDQLYSCPCSYNVKIKLSGTSIKVWMDSALVIDTTDSSHVAGTVAFDGETVRFDNLKIGYDNNADNDIDDAGDDLAVDEDFGATSCSPAHDHAGNLVDDCTFRYTYDAWNRLVKVQSSKDSGAVTYQTSEFYADGRRANKVVTKSGSQDATTRYYYDGQKIIETRSGSNVMVQQFIHGTQYIDELVMVRVKDKGEMYVHQDANWNAIGMTDMGRHVLEHNVLSPYGELTVNQETGFGDRDGDQDIDSVDKGTVGTTCTGTVSGSCRILDLDFDSDYDSSDATLFDALPQGWQAREGLIASAVNQPFAHQGLLYEPEMRGIQNRLREYVPVLQRFLQWDPLNEGPSGLILHRMQHGGTAVLQELAIRASGLNLAVAIPDRLNSYDYERNSPIVMVDPSGGCGRNKVIPKSKLDGFECGGRCADYCEQLARSGVSGNG